MFASWSLVFMASPKVDRDSLYWIGLWALWTNPNLLLNYSSSEGKTFDNLWRLLYLGLLCLSLESGLISSSSYLYYAYRQIKIYSIPTRLIFIFKRLFKHDKHLECYPSKGNLSLGLGWISSCAICAISPWAIMLHLHYLLSCTSFTY